MKKLLVILLALFVALPMFTAKTKPAGTDPDFGVVTNETNYIAFSDPYNTDDACTLAWDFHEKYIAEVGNVVIYREGGNGYIGIKCQTAGSWDIATVDVNVDMSLAQLKAYYNQGHKVYVLGKSGHAHGLDTVDTSDDQVFFMPFGDDCIDPATGNVYPGSYYLDGDYKLTRNIVFDGEYGLYYICLGGHIFDCNGYSIEITNKPDYVHFTSCKDTAHKFKADSKGIYTLDKNGDKTVKGGIITGVVDFSKYNDNILESSGNVDFDNISFVGIKSANDLGGYYTAFSYFYNRGNFTIKNATIVGNGSTTPSTIEFFTANQGGISIFENCEFKNNYFLHGGVLNLDKGEFLLENVTVTKNTTERPAVYLSWEGTKKFVGKIIIDDNEDFNGKPNNLVVEETTILMVADEFDKISTDSLIGIKPDEKISVGSSFKFAYAIDLGQDIKSVFRIDDPNYFIASDKEGVEPAGASVLKETQTYQYAYLVNKIKEQPTTENDIKFVLHPEGLTGLNVSYQWKYCTGKEIVHKDSGKQDYVDTKFNYADYMDVEAIYVDGLWYATTATYGYGGLVLKLKKGDILKCESAATNGFVVLTGGSDFSIDVDGSRFCNYSFDIPEDGTYGIMFYAPTNGTGTEGEGMKFTVVHPTDDVAGQTTNQLTPEYNGYYLCKATLKKGSTKYATITSDPVEVTGKTDRPEVVDTGVSGNSPLALLTCLLSLVGAGYLLTRKKED